MAWGRRSKIQQREATDIARKLGAEIKEGAKHSRALVYWNGALIAQFLISRSKTKGHGHIPGLLFVNETAALAIARCSMTRDEYFDLLESKGKLPSHC